MIFNNFSKPIAIFLPSLYGGGAEKTMLNLASGIAARGYKVDLVLVKAKGPYLDQLSEKIRVIDLKAHRSIMCFPALIRYLRYEQPECLLSAMHVNTIALIARILSGVSTKVIVSERNTISLLSKNTSNIRLKLISQIIRYFYPLADGIIAVSKAVAEDLSQTAKISIDHIKVIYNPVITPLLRKKAKVPLKHPWFVDNAPPVILAVGSLTMQKDFKSLIEAFAYVRRTHAARLLILGEGEERRELETLVKKRNLQNAVMLPGFVPNPYPYMISSSVFVLPSRWEGLPGVLIEALFCGIPIVATDCPGGTREIISNNNYSIIVPVGDVEAISVGIKKVINGKAHTPTPDSWKPFELETVVDQYLEFLLRA